MTWFVRNIAIVLVLFFGYAKAQVATRMDQYFLDPSIINSAAVNSQNNTHLGLFYNKLFSGVEGSPRNILLNVSSHKASKRYGFGGLLGMETIGFVNNYNGYISYAYTLPVSKNARLTLSPQIGFMAQRLNTQEIEVIDATDPYYQALINGQRDTKFDVRLSGLYQFKGLKLGISSGRITNPSFEYKGLNQSELALYPQQNLSNIYSSVRLLVRSDLEVEPVFSSTFFDFKEPFFQYGVNFKLKNRMWAGVHYSGNKNLAINLGGIIDKSISIGYSYSLPMANNSRLLGSGHELGVLYTFKNKNVDRKMMEDKFVLYKIEEHVAETALNETEEIEVSSLSEVKSSLAGNTRLKPMALLKVSPSAGYYLCTSFATSEDEIDEKLREYWEKGIAAYKFYHKETKLYYSYVDRFKTLQEAEQAKWNGKYGADHIWTKYIKGEN